MTVRCSRAYSQPPSNIERRELSAPDPQIGLSGVHSLELTFSRSANAVS
jgi:hypothetical protein